MKCFQGRSRLLVPLLLEASIPSVTCFVAVRTMECVPWRVVVSLWTTVAIIVDISGIVVVIVRIRSRIRRRIVVRRAVLWIIRTVIPSLVRIIIWTPVICFTSVHSCLPWTVSLSVPDLLTRSTHHFTIIRWWRAVRPSTPIAPIHVRAKIRARCLLACWQWSIISTPIVVLRTAVIISTIIWTFTDVPILSSSTPVKTRLSTALISVPS